MRHSLTVPANGRNCSKMMAVCLLPLLLVNAAETGGVLHDDMASKSSIFDDPTPTVSASETYLMLRRRLAEGTSSLANDETAKTAAKRTSTADLVAKAKEEAKKKIDEALKAAISDNDKKKEDNKKQKVPKFSVHKKPISSASLTKVADSVAKAAALEKEKKTEKDIGKITKDADDTKVTTDNKTSTVTKTTVERKTKDTKTESTHADEAKKLTTKTDDKTKPNDNKKENITSDAKTSVATATTTSGATKVEPIKSQPKAHLPKPAKPNSIKDIDKYKEKLKKTRDESYSISSVLA